MLILGKATSEQDALYDIDCSDFLPNDVTIAAVIEVVADEGGMTFADPVVNAAAVTYTDEDGKERTAAIGKAIQVKISGGTIPAGLGELMCTLRPLLTTSEGETLEGTVQLRLTNRAQS